MQSTSSSSSSQDALQDEHDIVARIHMLQRRLSEFRSSRRQSDAGISSVGSSDSLSDMTSASYMSSKRRLLIVANRLPVSLSRNAETKEWVFKMSSGGLVSGLKGMKVPIEMLWIGWPGMAVPEEEQAALAVRMRKEIGCVPVFLSEQLAQNYYAG
jgi:hypothetical protein